MSVQLSFQAITGDVLIHLMHFLATDESPKVLEILKNVRAHMLVGVNVDGADSAKHRYGPNARCAFRYNRGL